MEKKKSTGSKYKIDKGIPFPVGSGKGRRLMYQWGDMKVGDSIWLDKRTSANAAYQYCKRHNLNWKFTSAQDGPGFRVWRIK